MPPPPAAVLARRPSMRFQRNEDAEAIRAMMDESFGAEGEGRLVERLMRDGDLLFTLVAEVKKKIVGAIAFSDLPVYSENEDIVGAALAPVAVARTHRGRGIGTGLVRAGLAKCREKGVEAAVVFGHPRFFSRFGFTSIAAEGLRGPFSGPHFQAVALQDRGSRLSGEVTYPSAFFDQDPA